MRVFEFKSSRYLKSVFVILYGMVFIAVFANALSWYLKITFAILVAWSFVRVYRHYCLGQHVDSIQTIECCNDRWILQFKYQTMEAKLLPSSYINYFLTILRFQTTTPQRTYTVLLPFDILKESQRCDLQRLRSLL